MHLYGFKKPPPLLVVVFFVENIFLTIPQSKVAVVLRLDLEFLRLEVPFRDFRENRRPEARLRNHQRIPRLARQA